MNGAIEVVCKILPMVVASASESELAGLFYNGQTAVPLITTLVELGHPQPPTPLKTDNATASGIATKTVKQRRSKSMDMRFHWIRDRVKQGQFHVYWEKSTHNLADYFTKHHPAEHHRAMRPLYLHTANYTVTECGEGVLIPSGTAASTTEPSDRRTYEVRF
jgi:hypothetical protein